MLRARIITAAIGVPIALGAAWAGGWLFTAMVALLAVGGWREFYRLLPFPVKPNLVQYMGGLFTVLFIVIEKTSVPFLSLEVFWMLSVLCLFSTIFILRDSQIMPVILCSIAGVGYLGVGFAQFIKVRNWELAGIQDGGLILLAMVVVATWMNDSFAYFVGTRIGRRRLCPEISPGKSWEGACAGVFAAMATIVAVGMLCQLPFSIFSLLLLGFVVGCLGILGDLAESGLKRWSGVKDSGEFFPGHGGVLDRLDSLLFVVPFTSIWLTFTLLTF